MPEEMEEYNKMDGIKVSQLLLDDHNFRFPEDALGAKQKALLKIIDRDFNPLSIGKSLVDNGYFVEEPLVVIPKPPSNMYIVVEGNRRLAALKFLLDEEMRNLAQDPGAWRDLANRLKEDLSIVPVVIYDSREELTAVLGYRHISGIMKWNPQAKARFICNLVEQRGREANFAEIAREIGSTSSHIRNQYIAYRTYLQAKNFQIDTSKLENIYAVFYRAITGNRSIAQFIGLPRDKDKSPHQLRNPVPPKKADALEELIGFIHGTDKVKPVIKESRELSELGETLAIKHALDVLRVTRNLQRAYELTGGELRRLLDNLKAASYYLDMALIDIHRHINEPGVKDLVRRCMQTIAEIVKKFPDVQNELVTKL